MIKIEINSVHFTFSWEVDELDIVPGERNKHYLLDEPKSLIGSEALGRLCAKHCCEYDRSADEYLSVKMSSGEFEYELNGINPRDIGFLDDALWTCWVQIHKDIYKKYVLKEKTDNMPKE